MERSARLSDRLAWCSDEAPEWQGMLDEFVERLANLGVGKAAPAVGSTFQPISLPDYQGLYRNLADLIADGPLVLSFVRGGWCPYCRHEIEAWGLALPALTAAGGRLAVVDSEVGGRAAQLAALLGGPAEILCDVDYGAALELGLAFYAGTDLIQLYLERGIDLSDLYGTSNGFLPIPATFVIGSDSVVRFAFVNPDFRVRAEPSDVIDLVASMRG